MEKNLNKVIYVLIFFLGFSIAMLLKGSILFDLNKAKLQKMDGSIKVGCGSDSMGLTLDCEDTLYYELVMKDEPLEMGQIYIYRKYDNNTIVHRLVGCIDIDCNMTIFKGDNNKIIEKIDRKNIIYKVVGVEYNSIKSIN